MIVVKIELHSASTGQVSELGRVEIINDGTGTVGRGNYRVRRIGKHRRRLGEEARVENHARKSRTIFNLLRKALEALRV